MENAYLNIAKRDIETAEIMFEAERYPEALFYLQQSAEKAIKYIALRTEITSKKEVITYVGHDIRNFIIRVTQDFVYKNRPEEFSNYDRKQINISINKISNSIISGDTVISEFIYIFNIENIIKLFEGCNIKKTKSNHSNLVKKLKSNSESLESVLAAFRLFIIAFFTFNHYEDLRYPVKEKNKIYNTPDQIYKKGNPVIANLDLVIQNLKLSIELIEKGFEESTFIRISEKKRSL